jgi:3-methyladenine DNA glycosylase Tag
VRHRGKIEATIQNAKCAIERSLADAVLLVLLLPCN